MKNVYKLGLSGVVFQLLLIIQTGRKLGKAAWPIIGYVYPYALKCATRMETSALKNRFKVFALAIVRFAEALPDGISYRTIKGQIIRSGTSSAANYRAACRRKSTPDFIAKMGIVEEELDETMFWLEFTVGLAEEKRSQVSPLWKEADELLSITVASIKSSRLTLQKKQEPRP
ncbi:MAG: four helix bundle protein [Saprospiraceae bacterium]